MDHFKPNSVWIPIVLDALSDGGLDFFMGGPHVLALRQLLVPFRGHFVKHRSKAYQEALRSKNNQIL